MSEPARRIAAKYSSESCKYVLPPTTKAEALESLKAQLSLISAKSNWASLVNDRHSNFATTMAQFSTQARRTPSGLPLQNHSGNPFRTFHQVFDELMESFGGSKSTGFENRIRMASNEAGAHLMYRTICELLLTVAGADEIQSATPHELVYKFMVKDPTEVFVKEEAHSGKKQKSRKWRLTWALSFSDNLLWKLLFGPVSKNLIAQFQRDTKEGSFSEIGIGHDNDGLENVLSRLIAMHRVDGTGQVSSTDDASNWDLSTSRNGFMLGGIILFHAIVGGLTDDNLVDVTHRSLFGFLCVHAAHVAIFGADLVELSVFGLMPSGIWYTGLLNSIMQSMAVILAGSTRAISVGDDNVRGPPRIGLSSEISTALPWLCWRQA